MSRGIFLGALLGYLLLGELQTGSHARSHEGGSRYGQYIGCFEATCMDIKHDKSFDNDTSQMSNNYTPDNCTGLCYAMNYPLAGIVNETDCMCSCLNCSENSRVKDDYCGLPCRGDTQRFCGGTSWTSIYQIDLNADLPSDCDERPQFIWNTWKLACIVTSGVLGLIIVVTVSIMTYRWFCFVSNGKKVRRETPRSYSAFIQRRHPRSSQRSICSAAERNSASGAAVLSISTADRASRSIDFRPPVPVPRSKANLTWVGPFYHKVGKGIEKGDDCKRRSKRDIGGPPLPSRWKIVGADGGGGNGGHGGMDGSDDDKEEVWIEREEEEEDSEGAVNADNTYRFLESDSGAFSCKKNAYMCKKVVPDKLQMSERVNVGIASTDMIPKALHKGDDRSSGSK